MPTESEKTVTFRLNQFAVRVPSEIVRHAGRQPLNPNIPAGLALSYLHRELDERIAEHMPRGFSAEAVDTLPKSERDWLMIRLARLLAYGHREHPEPNPHPDTYVDNLK